jgi:conjugation system TraG family ATPase
MYRLNEFHTPILEITDEAILANTGDLTVCYELIRPAIYSLTNLQLKNHNESWVKALRALPFETAVHIQDSYTTKSWNPPSEKDDPSFLQQANDRHFAGRRYLANSCFCYITKRAGGRKLTTSGISTLIMGSLVPDYVRDPKLAEPFLSQCEQFRTILMDGGLIRLRRVTAAELIGTHEQKGILERYCSLAPAEDITLADIAFERGIWIGGRECLIYTLADAENLPVQCRPHVRYEPYSTDETVLPIGFATALGLMLDCDHIYNQYIFLPDPLKTLASMETRRRRLKSLAGQSRENAVASETIGQFLDEAAVGQRLPVKAHFNVMAWEENPDKVPELKRKISSAISRLGATPYHETSGAPQIWWAGIPGNAGEFPMNDTFDTFAEQAACFLLPETNYQSSISPFGICLGDRQSGIPLHVDISDEPMRQHQISNRNKFVLGGSGSGKSFFTNHLVRQYHEQGAHIVLVDVGGSYKSLCQVVGGKYFAYSENDPIRFNPFGLDPGRYPDTETKESLKTLLLALWKKSDEPYRRSEYVALSNAIQEFYQHSSRPYSWYRFDHFYEFMRDKYKEMLEEEKVKPEEFDIDNFLYVLRPFYKGGEYDYLLNAVEGLGLLNERLIIFDLDEIKDHPILFPVVTIIIMEVFISKMRRLKGIRKVILIEEAWKAIAKEGMGEYIKYLFKTVRKFFGEAIVVTQDIEDIISSPIVKNAIINNSDCKILLDQSKFLHRFDQLQELLGLTEMDKAMVLSLNKANDPAYKYKEVFIGLANGPSKVYRTEVSVEEYLTYTTEESERVKVQEAIDRQGEAKGGLASLARDIRSGAIRFLLPLGLFAVFMLAPGHASAQVLDIIAIINAAVKKVIVAADLQVQRLQTQTIALQDAEKALENSMAGDLLDDITGWVQDQEDLYGAYYQELWQVKSALSSYGKAAALIGRQVNLVKEEERDWAAVQHDPHFSVAELGHIGRVYAGILGEAGRNVQQLQLVVTAFVTQMDDAGRLRLIDEGNRDLDRNERDLREFTQENSLLSLARAKDEADILSIKAIYNLP